MIIGIDISSIPYGTGVSNYTLNLVKNLVKIDKKNIYKLFFSSLRQPFPEEISKLKKFQNVRTYHYHLPPTFLEFFWNRLHILPIELFIGKCDVFHTWDWTQPPTFSAKTITTIHDFVPLLFPETQHKKTISVFKQKLYWSKLECDYYICVSQNTRNDLKKLVPSISSDKISVIYEAAESKYDEYQKLTSSEKRLKSSIIQKQYGLNNYILAQGTREPRKNLARLVDAFKLFLKNNPGTDVVLAITGKYGWGGDLDNIQSSRIKILGYIPEKDIVALHARAICLVYPSLYEGFGLPIVKSMKVGTPVITSNISSMAEISGDAAILVDPTNIAEIEKAISSLVNSVSIQKKYSKRGLKQSQKFSWLKTAEQTLLVYEKLLPNKL